VVVVVLVGVVVVDGMSPLTALVGVIVILPREMTDDEGDRAAVVVVVLVVVPP